LGFGDFKRKTSFWKKLYKLFLRDCGGVLTQKHGEGRGDTHTTPSYRGGGSPQGALIYLRRTFISPSKR